MVTIVIPISRDTFLQRLFASLEFLICDREQVSLFTYVDGSMALFEKARNMTVASKFKNRLCVYRSKGIPSVSNMKSRRQRIADIHNEIKNEIATTEYVFGIEDDTIVPPNALRELKRVMLLHTHAGFASGIELGRWGYTHIGAWIADDIYDTTKLTSIPLSSGIIEVDAAGMYCFLTKFLTYKSFEFKPFDGVLGPDIDFGMQLRRFGLKNYVDMNVRCEHWNIKKPLTFSNVEKIEQVQLEKIDGKWATGVI